MNAQPITSRFVSAFHGSLATMVVMMLVAQLVVACGGSDAETERTADGERAQAYVFLSPSEVSVAPGQSIRLQVDIANLPTNDAAIGYAISLSRETTRIDIATETNSPCASGTVSCRIWTITPKVDAPPGDYAFSVRASGTRTPVSEADARIRVVPIAIGKRAVISASAQHVVTADGRLWGRGPNATGQTGAGFESVGFDVDAPFVLPDSIDPFVPVGTDSDWLTVVSAGESAIALKQGGTVWGWGANPEYNYGGAEAAPPGLYHQFVLPSARNLQLRPRQIPGLTDIVAISAIDLGEGRARFLALTADGRLYGFGGGVDPRYDLRVPSTLRFPTTDMPLLVPRVVQQDGTQTPLTGVRAIAGGVRNSGNGWAVALLDDGTVLQMGRRDSTFFSYVLRSEHIPEGVYAARGMPFAVAGLPPNAIAVTVGSSGDSGPLYSLAATQDGSVWSWTADDPVPQRVTGFSGAIAALDASGSQVMALDRAGGLWRWEFGRTAPQRVQGVPAMGRLAHRGARWAISADCTAGRGALWDVFGAQEVGLFGKLGNDGCTSQGTVTLTISKIGIGTVSTDPVDQPLDLVCGVDCLGPISVPVRLRENVRVRGTPAPGWRGPYFSPECLGGQPQLDVSASCVVSFEPRTLEGLLTVRVSGPGRVTSAPAGIDCGNDCGELYPLGAQIRLTAMADPGYAFLRWSGPSNTNERDCRDGSVTMNVIGDTDDGFPLKSCIAVFGPLPRLSVAPKAGGTVTSTPLGINCGAVCTQPFAADTQIRLSAAVNDGYRFDGFIETECRGPITLTRDISCTPVFTSTVSALLTVNVVGDGRVTSPDGNISCSRSGETLSGICTYSYPVGTRLTLTSLPSAGWSLSQWSSDCIGGNVQLDVARVCTATFVPIGWTQVGSPIAVSGIKGIAIAVDRSVALAPKTYAATAEQAGAGKVNLIVRRYDTQSQTWMVVGGGPANADEVVSRYVFTPALAVSIGGTVTVAWAADEDRIRVKRLSTDGASWITLADNLEVDPAARVFGTQITTAIDHVIVAWLEGTATSNLIGRMAVKRYFPATQQWIGGLVRPTETNILAVRLNNEPLGHALLMAVPYSSVGFLLEGPLLVLREGANGTWNDVCAGSLITPTGSASAPNQRFGFGIAQNTPSGTTGPVAVFNNGDAVFARRCNGTSWVGLDGSATGQVATAATGGQISALTLASGEAGGVVLAWSQFAPRPNGGFQSFVQGLAANTLGTAVVPLGTTKAFDPNFNVSQGGLSLTLQSDVSPVFGAVLGNVQTVDTEARVFRYVP